ncbi:MAG: bifunctional metallophosphatase/5'-nucleotidase [Bacteroidales bacterium]|nr:bifunctional metallophosphatase/5'-nucleotidase [Bacteroidales bacterium]
MKKFLVWMFASAITAITFAAQPVKIVIIHTNDLHSRLQGYSPESVFSPLSINDDQTVGGFSRIAAIIKNEKDTNEGITIISDGGDFLMGTLFQSLEVSTGFQLSLMRRMGYDVVCLGNHEFDFGPGKLAEILTSSKARGEIPAVLCSNAVFSSKDNGDDKLEKLLNEDILRRSFIVERNGIKIGFFSIFGKVADHDAPYAPPVTFAKQISTAKKMVKELKNSGCDIIICISHSGIEKNKKGEWSGEDVKLARAVPGINVILSGHTHTKLEKPLIVNGVTIVQTGEYGKYVGRLEMTYADNKTVTDNYRLIPVDDRVKGDEAIQQAIDEQRNRITTEILQPLGYDYEKPVTETDFPLECDVNGDFISSNLGPMIADAIHFYVNKHSPSGTDIAMVAAGVVRDNIVPGIQKAPDIFRIMSLGSGSDNIPGYPLARLYVTGKELKNILEILQVAYKSSPDNFCYYSGFRVKYDPGKGLFRKIKKIEIIDREGNPSVVDFSKKNSTLYSITANSYMLEFIGIIKKMSFGLVNVVPKNAEGKKITDMKTTVIDMNEVTEGLQEGKEWLALMEYLASMADTDGDSIPEIDRKYSSSVKTFFEGN